MFRKLCFLFILCCIQNNANAFNSITYLPVIPDSLSMKVSGGKTNFLIIDTIILKGNKVTKPMIIFRELLFHENDTIDQDNLSLILEKSRKNLLNTSLFNFVKVDTLMLPDGKIDITVEVIERWYIWPMPFFQLSERNFNVWWQTKDFSKTDYGLYLTWENFRGRKESLVLLLRLGYDETYGLSYKIPYINKRKTFGMGISGGFSGNHEVAYNTENNKQVFFKDKEDFVRQNIFSTFNITYRKSIYNTHTFQINYNDYLFSDTLLALNKNFSSQKHLQFFTFYYLFKNDHRDIKAYPLNGYYFDLELVKHGLGVLNKENINMAFAHASIRKYWNLYNRWYFAGGINAKISTAAIQPFFMERGLGFGNDFVRSYEYYVIDGQNFALLKSNLKFELVPTRVKDLKFIPSKKFSKLYYSIFINLLADAAYVDNRQCSLNNNYLANTALYGTGIGLDFVTYYDKVLRLEFSINRKGEKGIFMHFVSPI